MKTIGLTMRVDTWENLAEKRDAIDQRWYAFLRACLLQPMLLPNSLDNIKSMDLKHLAGFVFTGGGSLKALGGIDLERDEVEAYLLQYSIRHGLPILGVCRGMQFIQNHFGTKLQQVLNHVKTRHCLSFNEQNIEVNSYHDYGALESVQELNVIARSNDGVIESIRHVSLPILGIMWHPEREMPFSDFDIKLFQSHFTG